MASNTSYSDPKFGLVRRIVIQEKDDVGSAAAHTESFQSVPERTSIVKFGVIPAASDVICTTTTTFQLKTEGGTVLATFVPGSAVLGTGEATGAAPETATTIAKNQVVQPAVGVAGDSGSVLYFVDLQEHYDAA